MRRSSATSSSPACRGLDRTPAFLAIRNLRSAQSVAPRAVASSPSATLGRGRAQRLAAALPTRRPGWVGCRNRLMSCGNGRVR